MSYPQPQKPERWWAEVIVLTKVVFGILFWPLMVLLGIVTSVGGMVILFTIHWAYGVLLLAFLLAALLAFARWERRRPSSI